MQIHELTSKRQTTNEASIAGALKGAGAVLGAVAKNVGQQALQKYGLAKSDQFVGQRVAPSQRPEAGLQVNTALLQQMTKKAQEAWTLTQQELAKRARPPVASAALLPTDQLKPHLEALVDQLVGNNGYTKAGTSQDPAMDTGIAMAKNSISTAIDKILELTKEKPEQAKRPLQAAWTELVTKGIGPLQTYSQQSAVQSQAVQQPNTVLHPDAAKLTQALGQEKIDAISQYTTGKTIPKTGIPAVDGLLTAAGATLK